MNYIHVPLQIKKSIYGNGLGETKFTLTKTFKTTEVAILLIGMWNTHYCDIAKQELDIICPQINDIIIKYRQYGIKIIIGSSPINNDPNYKFLREPIKDIPFSKLTDYGMNYPPLPLNCSLDGGIEKNNPNFSRENVKLHPSIKLEKGDLLSGNVKEIVNYLNYHQIKHMFVVGTHLNMCILDKPYGIRNLLRYGVPISIMEDLVDPLYNSESDIVKTNPELPKTRQEAKQILLDYIETYFCPTTNSNKITITNEK